MDRLAPEYQNLCRHIIDQDKPIEDVYNHYARMYGVYDQKLYDEAVRIGKESKQRYNSPTFIKRVVKRMWQLPVAYNVIICKQVPCRMLVIMIEDKSFRPLAEELMTIIFGV